MGNTVEVRVLLAAPNFMPDFEQRSKVRQLGMPWGTASARLKKAVMFELVVRAGLDTCFRCGERIETAADLSIDHKVDWVDVDSKLFWDLSNVAFSHRACNKNRFQRVDIRNAPEGQSWCSGCGDFRAVSEFSSNRSRWNGLHAECRTCVSNRR